MRSRRLVSQPPEALHPLVERPALMHALDRRWQIPVTVVTGPVGCGKTVAVAQAVSRARGDRRGLEAWVSCQVADDDAAHLATAILDAMAVRDDATFPHAGSDGARDAGTVSALADHVAGAVWTLAPLHVCVVVDQVHVLHDDGDGLRLLRALAQRLPGNGHLVAVTRQAARMGLARAIAEGSAALVDVAGFGDTELAAPLSLAGPAAAPQAGALEALALLRTVGPLPRSHAERLIGATGDVATALAGLPFVLRSGDTYLAHERWDREISGRVDADLRRRWTLRAVDLYRGQGDLDRAFDLCAGSHAWDLALDVLATTCRSLISNTDRRRIARWLRLLPAQHRSGPQARLAEVLVEEVHFWPAARERLRRCVTDLAASGDPALELIAIARFGVLSWQAGDLHALASIRDRVDTHAARGEPLAVRMRAVIAVLSAEVGNDAAAMWSGITELTDQLMPEPLRSMAIRYRSLLELMYGSPKRAADLCERVRPDLSPDMRPELDVVHLWALWLDGRPSDAHRLLDDMLCAPRFTFSVPYLDASRELMAAFLGEPEPGLRSSARALEERATMAADEGALVPSLLLATACAIRHLAAGREAEAAATMRAALARCGDTPERGRSALIRAAAVSYVLLPETRATWDSAMLGEGPRAALDAAALLLGCREGDPEAVRSAPVLLADPRSARTRLPPVWLVELAVRARPDLVHDVVRECGQAGRAALALLGGGDDPELSAAARRCLSTVDAHPEAGFVLRILGPVTIEADGEPVTHPHWRRERVRALFALLARRRQISRAEASSLLWPDLEADAAANNLRVTLTYLQRVLEPYAVGKQGHVTADSSAIRFTGHASWVIDVTEFERHLDRAAVARAETDLPAEMRHLREAIDWYRGPLLSDGKPTAAQELEHDRLLGRMVAACTRLGSLLLAAGKATEAHRLAVLALEHDAWSEPAAALVVECHLVRGDHVAAVRSYRRCRARLADLGLTPSEPLLRVHAMLRAVGATP